MKNIFHIGYHKTASTWFQQRFYPFVENLSNVSREDIKSYFYYKRAVNFPMNSDLVFCDEELSGNIHNAGLSGFLQDNIAKEISQFNNPKVIVFIRNQYDIIISSYLQYIKEGGTYSLRKYLYHKDFDRPHRSPLFSYKHFDYHSIITTYIDLIGKENVYVYLYEDFIKDQKRFILEFNKDHNFKTDINLIDFSKNNFSYSYLSFYMARIFNRFTRKDVLYKHYFFHIPLFYEYSREIYSRIRFFKIKKSSFLDAKLKSEIKSFYADSNSLLKKKFSVDIDKYNYPL